MFACIASSLRSAFSLRLRCFSTPAASSMKPRRSSGVACKTASSWPWPTMTCISRPMPESESNSWTSSNRQLWPLIEYSEPPVRNMIRLIVTSVYSTGRAPSVLSIVSDTSARPSGGRPAVPAKMTSSILPPRKLLGPCSPMTHARASTTLDLPEPLGPTTQVMPGSRRRVVAEANDLNPRSVRLFKYTRGSLSGRLDPVSLAARKRDAPLPAASLDGRTLERLAVDVLLVRYRQGEQLFSRDLGAHSVVGRMETHTFSLEVLDT